MKTLLATLLATASVGLAATPALAQQVDWRAAGAQDLTAIRDALRDNHPALVVGGGDAAFAAQLDAGLAEAEGRLDRVRDALDYAYLLRGYVRSLGDTNITIDPNWQAVPAWDGVATANFTTGWRNGAYTVTWVKDGVRGLPPLGSTLVSCDGEAADAFARSRLDGWEGDLDQPGDRERTAPYLFWDRGNPFIGSFPSECRFRSGNRERNYDIRTAFAPEAEREAAWRATIYEPQTPLAIEPWGANRAWIHMHSLSETGAEGFLAQVDAQLDALRAADVVVIDLRGADTGTPALGYSVANRLWGVDYRVAQQNLQGQIVYRVSPANRQYFVEVLGRMQNDAAFAFNYPGQIRMIQELIAQFDAAAAAGLETFSQPIVPPIPAIEAASIEGTSGEGEAVEGEGTADSPEPVAPVAAAAPLSNPVRGRVIVLVDGGCRNACLDVVDMLLTLPNVQVAGTPTGSDSIHFEPTRLTLPSGNAYLNYGHKTWLGRPRASNTPHTPAQGLTYTGNPVDEQAVRAWLEQVLAAG